MAAEKKGQIVIIKKYYSAAGHHGGSWKVALADFMTALMAFFLVMWLLSQSAETKQAVSDYFSTPSIIEYNFQNFGVELTLEKLFLDLVNEPLKAFQSFLEPIDKTPNVLDFGSQKVVAAFMADKMGDIAKNFSVSPEGVEFDLIDTELFVAGSATPIENFVTVMERVKSVTTGLSDATIRVDSRLFNQSVPGSKPDDANKVARERLDLIRTKVQGSLEHSTVDFNGNIDVQDKKGFVEGQSRRPNGMIHFKIRQKELKSDGTKSRKLETIFGNANSDMNVYESFVKQISEQRTTRPGQSKPARHSETHARPAESAETPAHE